MDSIKNIISDFRAQEFGPSLFSRFGCKDLVKTGKAAIGNRDSVSAQLLEMGFVRSRGAGRYYTKGNETVRLTATELYWEMVG